MQKKLVETKIDKIEQESFSHNRSISSGLEKSRGTGNGSEATGKYARSALDDVKMALEFADDDTVQIEG